MLVSRCVFAAHQAADGHEHGEGCTALKHDFADGWEESIAIVAVSRMEAGSNVREG